MSMDKGLNIKYFIYLEERKAEGYHAAVSANMNGLWSTKAFQDTFFHHPQFGIDYFFI